MISHQLFYSLFGRLYDRMKSFEDYQAGLLPALNEVVSIDGADIVEFGAGTGYLTRKLAPKARSIYAFDRSAHMIRVARRLAKRAGLSNCHFGTADHRNIPMKDHSVDIALAGWSLLSLVDEWWERGWKSEVDCVIAEMLRLLNGEGVIVVLETANLFDELPFGEVFHPKRREFLGYLEDSHGFEARFFHNDWQYVTPGQAARYVWLFHGASLVRPLSESGGTIVPECAGIWWLKQ